MFFVFIRFCVLQDFVRMASSLRDVEMIAISGGLLAVPSQDYWHCVRRRSGYYDAWLSLEMAVYKSISFICDRKGCSQDR